MATWRRPTAIAGTSLSTATSPGLVGTEERHEHDLPYIQMVHDRSAGVHGRGPTELRVYGRRWDEVCSVRSDSYPAKSLNVTFAAARSLGMSVRTGKKPSLVGDACFALFLLMLTASSGWAATTPIYKCLDKRLGLLYTDEPCKDGEQLDIRAGDADPLAVARLERQRDALDQSAAQRIADQRRAAGEGDGASRLRYEPVEARESSDYGPAYVSDYGFVSYPFMRHHPVRARHPKPHHMRHFAPPPPFVVPRR